MLCGHLSSTLSVPTLIRTTVAAPQEMNRGVSIRELWPVKKNHESTRSHFRETFARQSSQYMKDLDQSPYSRNVCLARPATLMNLFIQLCGTFVRRPDGAASVL
jgi:hypothetical protein